jgi:hypothetical protein
MKKRSYYVTKNRQNTVSMFHVSSEKITTKDVLVNAFPILGPTNKVLNKKVLLWTLLMTHLVNCQKNEICWQYPTC